MFGWMKNKKKEKHEASRRLLQAVMEREEACRKAVHKMNLLIVDKRFINIPVTQERRAN